MCLFSAASCTSQCKLRSLCANASLFVIYSFGESLASLSIAMVFLRYRPMGGNLVKSLMSSSYSSVSRRQCLRTGACITFTVMDHDFMLANDFAGEVYFSLSNIPGITGDDISGFTALKPITLPLMQPRKGESKSSVTNLIVVHISSPVSVFFDNILMSSVGQCFCCCLC